MDYYIPMHIVKSTTNVLYCCMFITVHFPFPCREKGGEISHNVYPERGGDFSEIVFRKSNAQHLTGTPPPPSPETNPLKRPRRCQLLCFGTIDSSCIYFLRVFFNQTKTGSVVIENSIFRSIYRSRETNLRL